MSVKAWQRVGAVLLYLWMVALAGEWFARRSNPARVDLDAIAAYSANGHHELQPDGEEEVLT